MLGVISHGLPRRIKLYFLKHPEYQRCQITDPALCIHEYTTAALHLNRSCPSALLCIHGGCVCKVDRYGRFPTGVDQWRNRWRLHLEIVGHLRHFEMNSLNSECLVWGSFMSDMMPHSCVLWSRLSHVTWKMSHVDQSFIGHNHSISDSTIRKIFHEHWCVCVCVCLCVSVCLCVCVCQK